MLVDNMIFVKEIVNINNFKRKAELNDKLKEVNNELLICSDKITSLHEDAELKESEIARVSFFSDTFNSYAENYGINIVSAIY